MRSTLLPPSTPAPPPPGPAAAPSLARRVALAASVAAALAPAAALAGEPPSGPSAAAARIEALEADVRRLRAGQERLDADRAEAVRALVCEVLADADTRAALLADEITAGWDEEFFIASPDGRFELEMSGQLQTRFVWNRRQRTDSSNTEYGFEMRRVKLKFDGGIEEVGFSIGLAADDNGGEVRLQAFNLRFDLDDRWQLRLGRARPPLTREEHVSSKRQLLAERSLVVKAFGQTRTLGVNLRYRGDRLRVSAGVMDAADGFADQSWRTSARLDWLLAGAWDATDDFTSFPDDEPMVALGAGVLYERGELADPAVDDDQILRASADLMVELGGATAFAAIVANRADRDNGDTLDQLGAVVQGGVFLSDEYELFGRYEWGDADGEAPGLSAVTVGINRYFRRHQLKWTFDVGYGLNEVDAFWASSGAGWRRDRRGEDGQVAVRAQFQLLF